jgi:hypothetical protein
MQNRWPYGGSPEYKSTAARHTHQRPRRQRPQLGNLTRTSNSKASDKTENSRWEWFESMMEYKSIESTSNMQMQIHQESKSANPTQMRHTKESRSHRNKSPELLELMTEYRRLGAITLAVRKNKNGWESTFGQGNHRRKPHLSEMLVGLTAGPSAE